MKVQFVEINWNNKYNELTSGAVDCLWNGMTITDEGKKGRQHYQRLCRERAGGRNETVRGGQVQDHR